MQPASSVAKAVLIVVFRSHSGPNNIIFTELLTGIIEIGFSGELARLVH
jgi:hypothetical protein